MRRSVIDRGLLAGDAPDVAPQLLGAILEVRGVSGRITEVEAYTADDPASHSSRGMTRRNATMFAGPGTLYVYLIYGLHHCANVVTGAPGDGQAVLIRAVEPLDGHEVMLQRRGPPGHRHLADGPGKLCQAMGLDGHDDGVDLCEPASTIRLLTDGTPPPRRPVVGRRIGISAGVETPWNWRWPAGA